MWLFVPSTSLASAPAAAGLIEPSSWQSRLLARSCVWRGKPSPSLIWSRRCSSASWLQRLCGAMSEPSLADASAASWMASLVASRANPTAWPESGLGAMTSAISGARPGASSSSPGRGSSSSKTSAGCFPKVAPSGSEETFKDWAARLRAASSARRKLARAMSASGCSSSGWRTPNLTDSKGGGRDGEGQIHLCHQTATWPTPRGSEAGPDFRKADRSTTGLALPAVVAKWPSPTAHDGRRPGADLRSTQGLNLSREAAIWSTWSTPRASDGEKGSPNQNFGAGGVPLAAQTVQWPPPTSRSSSATMAQWMTPRVSTGDYTRDRGQKSAERLTLEGQAKWSTPSVAISTGGQTSRSGTRKGELLLSGQAEALCSPPLPATSVHGRRSPTSHLNAYRRYRATTCSWLRSERRALLLTALRRRDGAKAGEIRRLRRGWTRTAPTAFVRPSFRRSLNPRFVGDLMGWPPGLTSFECSETASSIWRARMRSALSQLTSPAAPPAQLSLFG